MSASAPSPLSRRTFLLGAVAGVGALAAACGGDGSANNGAAATTAGATTVPTAPTTPTTPPSTAPPAAKFVVSGPTTKPRVALTFHTNGDLGLADQLLDVLDTRHVKMTSFIVGNWLEANPDMAKRIADGGHEFANHTYTHPSFIQLCVTHNWMRWCAVATCSSVSPAALGPRPAVGHRRRHGVAR